MSIKYSAILAAFTLVTLAAAPVFATPSPRPTAALVEAQARADAAGTKASRVDADSARYAQRETRAKKQQDYKGGDYLVIGISSGAAIVILILVLLLI